MTAPVTASAALGNYLDVRYSASDRPYTEYPAQLARHLTTTHLSAHAGGRLLDLGCGRGEFLHGFAQLGYRAQGVDRCRPSQARFPEPVVAADFERSGLPFDDAAFDVVFNKSVFEHLHDVGHVLTECRRVLVPGGRLVSLVPDWRAQWRHFYDDWTHVRPFTLTGLTQCIASHGFRICHAERFRQLPFLWQRPYLTPVASLCSLLPERMKRHKIVRFSKEWMLLVVAEPLTDG